MSGPAVSASATSTAAANSAPGTEATAGTATALHIDWTRCDGRGLCAELLPELLDRDDWGYPRARDGSRELATRDGSPDITVPRALRRHAADAVAACPVLALRLRDTS